MNIRYTLFFSFFFLVIVANACSVCNSDFTEAEIKAYTFITGILALAPILGMAGFGYWLFRKYGRAYSEYE